MADYLVFETSVGGLESKTVCYDFSCLFKPIKYHLESSLQGFFFVSVVKYYNNNNRVDFFVVCITQKLLPTSLPSPM